MPSTTIPTDLGSGGRFISPTGTPPTLYTLLKEHKDRLDLLETAGTGDAVTIGILDAAGLLTATEVETALADIAKGGNGLSALIGVHRVRAVVTTNVADLTAFTVSHDGLTLVAGDRVLLKAQSTGAQEGIYVVGTVGGGTAPLTRAGDWAAAAVIPASTIVVVDAGTAGANTIHKITNAGGVTVATTNPTWETIKTSTELASTDNGKGAGLIGIEDAGAFTAAATVEAALAEIYQHLKSVQGHILLGLTAFRKTDANGDVGNAAAIGGVLASDTTPILRATNKAQEIVWAAGNADPIAVQISLPPELDDTADVTVDLWVQTDNAGGGGIDAATFTVESSWDGAAAVSDTATDGTPAITLHKITATIAAADVPSGAANLSLILTPAAHANDPTELHGIRVNYKKKILTS